MAKLPVPLQKLPPDTPTPWSVEEAYAIRGIAAGSATPHQQVRGMAWMIKLSGYYDLSYRPNERDTCFAEGKRSVGQQIVHLINLPPEVLAARRDAKSAQRDAEDQQFQD